MAIFISPFLSSGIVALVIYLAYKVLWLPMLVVAIGTVAGVWFAERIRKTVGCSRFMGRLLGTPELEKKWENNKDC